MMEQPRDLTAFDARPDGARLWRIAHLSDVHVGRGRYGFRIESGDLARAAMNDSKPA